MKTISHLLNQFAKPGRLEWIGLRPARKEPLLSVETAMVTTNGLIGDHRKKPGKRTVTLIQAEHLPAIASLCEEETEGIDPARLRRNLVVSGISLLALRKQEFKIGSAILRGTALCAPCSRMEEELGHGGYNAMRGHGGICAEVLQEGEVKRHDRVEIA